MAREPLTVRITALDAERFSISYSSSFGPLGGEPRVETRADLLALDLARIAATADLTGLVRAFSGSSGQNHGQRLCEWLFGDASAQTRVLAALHRLPQAVVTTKAVALVLHIDDPDLAAQPWSVLAWKGVALVEADWTIQVAVDGPQTSLSLPIDCRTLIVAPTYGDDRIGTQSHLDRLTMELPLYCPSGHFDTVSTLAGLREKLEQKWDIVYFYGHGSDDAERPGLLFAGSRILPPADFAELLVGCETKLLLLQCCLAGAAGWLGAAARLKDSAAVVIGHAARIPSGQARAGARDALRAILADGVSPVEAIRSRPQSQSFGWMTPVVFASLASDGWTSVANRHHAVREALPAGWPLRLDREGQRDRVSSKVHEVLLAGDKLALACVATGNADAGLAQLGEVLLEHARRSRIQIVRVALAKPDDSTASGWDESLRRALAVDSMLAVHDALRARIAREGLSDRRAVLLLDFGAHPEPLPVRVTEWLTMCRRWAGGLAIEDRARLLCVYGLVVPEEEHDKLAFALHASGALSPGGGVVPDLLPRLRDVEHNQIVPFLREFGAALSVQPAQILQVAQLVLQHLGHPPVHDRAPYERLLGWLATAKGGASWWAALGLDEAPGEEPSSISSLL